MRKRIGNICIVFCLLVSVHSLVAQNKGRLEQVFFETNSAEISVEQKDRWLAMLTNLKIDSVYLEAFCDTRGSIPLNDALAESRLQSVKQFLEKDGKLRVEWPISEAWGERKVSRIETDSSAMAYNRRVDVRLFLAESASRVDTVLKVSEVRKSGAQVILEQLDAQVDRIRLKNIQFIGGRDVFMSESYAELETLLQVMEQRPALRIEVQGHVCCLAFGAEDGVNLATGKPQLSLDRALAVRNYLIHEGIDSSRVEAIGLGGSKPLVYPEFSESERNINRRVEVRVLEK